MTNTDAKPPYVDAGCDQLLDRVGPLLEAVTGLEVAATSEMAADDSYLHPIYRTLQQAVRECLLVALDHLRCLAWSLQRLDEPFPYAHFSGIRTAITAASTALWMLSGSDATERRMRALEFYAKDYDSYSRWMQTVSGQPAYRNASTEELERNRAERDEVSRRQDLIVDMANTLVNPQRPFDIRSLVGRTSDTRMVAIAGGETAALGSSEHDPSITLLNTWQSTSGYAHARPWPGLRSKVFGEVDPGTGMQAVTQKGDPNAMFDAAFRALLVIEEAVRRMLTLSTEAVSEVS